MSEITILGASGTKGVGVGTSAFYIDKKNVIDAGNLLVPLEEKSAEIESIWLSHSHLDHIIDIAYIMDSYFANRKKPLNIFGLPETLKSVKEDFLNNRIWPNFASIKLLNSDEMSVNYQEITYDKRYKLSEDTYLQPYQTDHTVASCGYIVTKHGTSVIISLDTFDLVSTIEKIDAKKEITTLIVECSFSSRMEQLAIASKHLTPKLLFEKLKVMKNKEISICINHIKPLFLEEIRDEIAYLKGDYKVRILKDGEKIIF